MELGNLEVSTEYGELLPLAVEEVCSSLGWEIPVVEEVRLN